MIMKSNFITISQNKYNNLFIYLLFLLFAAIPLNKSIANVMLIEPDSIAEPDSLKYPRERFSINFGGFFASLNNDIIVGNEQLGLGISLNLEDALGLETSSLVVRGDTEYHFGKRGRSAARFEYFGLYRTATKVLESEIEIDSTVFPVGTKLSSKFYFQIFKGAYDYAFYIDERIRIGASIGLFVMPISFSTVGLNLPEVSTSITAPLPVLGLSTEFAITPKLNFKQSIEFLYLEFSNYKGVLTDFDIRLEYNPWRHIGFGIGFNSYNLNISVTAESNINLDFVGSLESSYAGLLFYGRYYF